MSDFDPESVDVVACDIFGTAVDWFTGVCAGVSDVFRSANIDVDVESFTEQWRDMYLPAVARIRAGHRSWANLDVIHREALDTLVGNHDIDDAVDDVMRTRLVRAWHALPAWPDAAESLARMRKNYTVAALSNGGFALLTHLLKYANLPFDCILSAELVRTYKPAPQAYRAAADLLDVDPARVLMVAAHHWDVAGAREAGLRTAFLERPREKGPNREADRAIDAISDLSVSTFVELVDKLGC